MIFEIIVIIKGGFINQTKTLCGIGMNTVWASKSDDELPEGVAVQGEEENRLKLQACPLVPWYRFNERLTFEGLIDIADEVGHDGPRVHLALDELSLLVSGGCKSEAAWVLVVG